MTCLLANDATLQGFLPGKNERGHDLDTNGKSRTLPSTSDHLKSCALPSTSDLGKSCTLPSTWVIWKTSHTSDFLEPLGNSSGAYQKEKDGNSIQIKRYDLGSSCESLHGASASSSGFGIFFIYFRGGSSGPLPNPSSKTTTGRH